MCISAELSDIRLKTLYIWSYYCKCIRSVEETALIYVTGVASHPMLPHAVYKAEYSEGDLLSGMH